MISKIEFEKIKSFNHNPSVSLYVPMELTGNYDKNRIRWKNACQRAQQIIEDQYPDTGDILAPARELINNEKFWAYQSKTLAGFYSQDYSGHFHLIHEHPELESVRDTFHTFPLLQEISNDVRVFILAISENETQFYEAVKDGIYPVIIHDKVVTNYAEAMSNIEDKSSLQHHTTRRSNAQFHANSSAEDKDTLRTRQYLRRIDDGIMEIIHDEQVPMVLACVEEYFPIYQEITRYPYLTDHLIAGNPEDLSPAQLHDNIQPLLREKRKQKMASFEKSYDARHYQNLTINDLDELTRNATLKNVDKVLIPFGYSDSLSREEVHQLDDALMKIYENGGEIIFDTAKEKPAAIKAIARFELN